MQILGAFQKVRVFNAKETAIAQAKQDQIKQAFEDWIFNDVDLLHVLTVYFFHIKYGQWHFVGVFLILSLDSYLFATANRKKFCSRIATGDFDAVIIRTFAV